MEKLRASFFCDLAEAWVNNLRCLHLDPRVYAQVFYGVSILAETDPLLMQEWEAMLPAERRSVQRGLIALNELGRQVYLRHNTLNTLEDSA